MNDDPEEYPDGWSAIPHSVYRNPKYSASAKLIYVSLSGRLGMKNITVSHSTLAGEASCSVATVKRALVELRDGGLIEWAKRSDGKGGQTTNEYRILLGPAFQQKPEAGVPF